MKIELRRIYGEKNHDGYRVLVDRVWPRGISKADANLDGWWKEIAPTDELRKWFDHDESRWPEFRKKYLHELSQKKEEIKASVRDVTAGNLVLLFGARDESHNNARVLKEYLEKLSL